MYKYVDEMWSCRGVGLGRVTSTIKMRNTKPVKLVLEAPNEQEEKKRRAIAFAEKSEAEKKEMKIVSYYYYYLLFIDCLSI